jgi:hypothetical protein
MCAPASKVLRWFLIQSGVEGEPILQDAVQALHTTEYSQLLILHKVCTNGRKQAFSFQRTAASLDGASPPHASMTVTVATSEMLLPGWFVGRYPFANGGRGFELIVFPSAPYT